MEFFAINATNTMTTERITAQTAARGWTEELRLMDNEIHIKSKDLCERCVYSDEFCEALECKFCAQRMYASNQRHGCRCDTIQAGTPCPYFEDVKI